MLPALNASPTERKHTSALRLLEGPRRDCHCSDCWGGTGGCLEQGRANQLLLLAQVFMTSLLLFFDRQMRRTALHLAAMGGHTRTALCLVDRGALLNRRDKVGSRHVR